MSIDSAVTRRTLLVAGAATVGAATLAACSSGSDGGGTSNAPASESSQSSQGKAQAGSATSAPAAPSAGSSSAPAADSLAALSELTVGEPQTVDLPNGKKGLLTRTSQTAVVCFSTVCTHEGCTVKPDGKKLACPCHGSVFEAATGKPTSGPAPSPLAKIDVKVVGDQVVAG